MKQVIRAADIKRLGLELGFQQVGITSTRLEEDEAHLLSWLRQGRHARWIICGGMG